MSFTHIVTEVTSASSSQVNSGGRGYVIVPIPALAQAGDFMIQAVLPEPFSTFPGIYDGDIETFPPATSTNQPSGFEWMIHGGVSSYSGTIPAEVIGESLIYMDAGGADWRVITSIYRGTAGEVNTATPQSFDDSSYAYESSYGNQIEGYNGGTGLVGEIDTAIPGHANANITSAGSNSTTPPGADFGSYSYSAFEDGGVPGQIRAPFLRYYLVNATTDMAEPEYSGAEVMTLEDYPPELNLRASVVWPYQSNRFIYIFDELDAEDFSEKIITLGWDNSGPGWAVGFPFNPAGVHGVNVLATSFVGFEAGPPETSSDVLSTVATIDHDLLIGVEEDQHHPKVHSLTDEDHHSGGYLYKAGWHPSVSDGDVIAAGIGTATDGMIAVSYDTQTGETLLWNRLNGTWVAVEVTT